MVTTAGPLTPVIAQALGTDPHLLDPWQAAGIRTSVFEKRTAEGRRLLIHLVNKNVPVTLPEEERVLQPVKNLSVRLPPTREAAPESVEVFVPGRETEKVRVRSEEGRNAEVLLEQLEDYAVISLVYE